MSCLLDKPVRATAMEEMTLESVPLNAYLQVRGSSISGLGTWSRGRIAAGSVLCRYEGPIVKGMIKRDPRIPRKNGIS